MSSAYFPQFHQGAGDDTSLDLMRALQEIPQHSLLIIDEVEASLHPRAQRRLINFLIKLSRLKRIQVIVSTHSPYVLEELPPEARVLLLPTNEGPTVIYGASPEFSLTKLDENVHPEAYVYVEDRTAAIWLREIITRHPNGDDLISRIAISSVGAANVVSMMGGGVADKKKLPFCGIGVIDGDKPVEPGCLKLPGNDAPERVVFWGLRDANWGALNERFGVGAGDLHTYLNDVILTPDHHRWPALIGDRVLKSSVSVWETLATEWCRICLTDADRDSIFDSIRSVLPGGD